MTKQEQNQDYYHQNHEKVKAKQKEWRENNRNKKRAIDKAYREKNKERHKIYCRLWNKSNRAHINKMMREKYHNNPAYNLRHKIATRIRRALRRNSKTTNSMELLGCDITTFKSHLESKFLSGMTWDNAGDWHIDHIRPCASFDLSDPRQQKVCFHYSNLQPLWAEDNLSKGARLSPMLVSTISPDLPLTGIA